MTQGASKQVNTEHEVRQIQAAARRQESQEIPVECKNLFEAPEQDKEIRTVLTKGVAGIGKSVSVQKFIVDWAEGKENQDITFIFPLAFREMNLKKKEKQSLTSLISQFFPETKGLNLARNNKFKVLFILDGLDECRLPLNFDGNETWCDVSSPASLDVLLTNLIKGNLLPSALIWITTRPAAAIKIPPECIDRVTEVQGFNDAQKKEEYFRKRFTDVDLANEIIDNVKQSKSLFIMCYIPVFCWISATVLQNILEEKRSNDVKNNQADKASKTLQKSNTEDTPKTLTQMYTHFLRFQILQSGRKYDGEYTPDVSWDKDAILSLGKLAFHQLERNNLLFYDTDLEDCGIDVSKASVYSGMCTQIFKEEKGIILGTTFCFVHLSIQEFIAALYAHLFLDIKKKSVFDQESTEQENKNEAMIDLLKTAVDKALESETGHLDLFLRFLLGLSLQTNHPLLRGLLTQQDDNDKNYKEIVQYIKKKLEYNLSPERSINLFYCLNELNDQTLVKEIQTQLREGSLSSGDLSPAQWSAVAFVLLTSDKDLEEFDLQKFKKSDECLFRLLEVVKISKKALLSQCALTEESCSALTSVLSSDSSSLKDLDLSNNNLKDSGVKLFSDGLKENCKLEKLRLSDCSITEEGYKALASALRSNRSHLIELDLTGNDPGQSGVKELNDLLQDGHCKLKTIRFLKSPAAEEACEYLTKVLGTSPLLLTELDLSGVKLGDLDWEKLSALLMDSHSKVENIKLNSCELTEKSCSVLATVLSSKTILKEINLNNSRLLDSGVKEICEGLKSPVCELKILKLSDCSITEEGYKALASALRSNPSHLIELDLRGNDPGQSGVKELDDLLQDQNCQLKTLRFLRSPAAEEACQYVTGIVGKNPLLLRELNLSEHKLGDTRVNQISALLQDKHFKLNTLILCGCSITEKQCLSMTSALCSNLSHLRELDLSGNELKNKGVTHLSDILTDVRCKLERLRLRSCKMTDEGCSAVTSALKSNPSHLRELNLSENKLGDSGFKNLSDLLMNPECKLEKLQLCKCSIKEKQCGFLTSALKSNPSHVRELDLSGNELKHARVKHFYDLLKNSHFKLERLRLRNCGIEVDDCSDLTSALKSNSSHLRELDLSGNTLGDKGVKNLYPLLSNECKLEKLSLCGCNITEKQFLILTPALCYSLSNLRELDLSGNKLENKGVEGVCEILKNPHCKLERLSLNDCGITDVTCLAQSLAEKKALQFLKELDLSKNTIGSSEQQLIDVLQNSECKLSLKKDSWLSRNTGANLISGMSNIGWISQDIMKNL
ncbi:hypothetical protein PO909_027944 [Leuciscus waleckii]